MATPAKDKLAFLRGVAGDGPVDALESAITKAHGEAALARIQLKAKAAPVEDDEEEMMEEEKMPMKKKGNPFTKKDDDEVELSPEEMEELALIAEVVTETVRPIFDAQQERIDALEEFAGQVEKSFETSVVATKEHNELKAKVEELEAKLKELTGEQPVKQKGYRPSADANTITVKDKEKVPGPTGDQAIAAFVSDMFKNGGH